MLEPEGCADGGDEKCSKMFSQSVNRETNLIFQRIRFASLLEALHPRYRIVGGIIKVFSLMGDPMKHLR